MKFNPHKHTHLGILASDKDDKVVSELFTSKNGTLYLLNTNFISSNLNQTVKVFFEVSKETICKLLAGQITYLDMFKRVSLFYVFNNNSYNDGYWVRRFGDLNTDYLPEPDAKFDANRCLSSEKINEYLGIISVELLPINEVEHQPTPEVVYPVWVNPEIESESNEMESESVNSSPIEVESDSDNQPIVTRKGKKF